MRTQEATLKEALAENKAAFERLRTDMAKHAKETTRTIVGVAVVIVALLGIFEFILKNNSPDQVFIPYPYPQTVQPLTQPPVQPPGN